MTGDGVVDGERGEESKVGHGEAEGVVVAVGAVRVLEGEIGFGTVEHGAGGEGENERDEKENGEMGR